MEKEYVTLNSGSKTTARSSKNTKSRRKTGHSKSNIRRSALETRRTGSSRTGMRKVNGSSKSTSPKTSKSKKKSRSRKMDIPVQYIAGGVVLIVLLIVIIFAVRSCGVSHKTPERVVKTLIESYESGNENKIKKCYGVTKADDNLQAEIDANIKYFAAHSPEKIQINSCDKIYQDGNYAFMYITYDLVLKDGQSYPCISTYMTQKKDDNKYYILAPSDVTNDMNKQAAEKYALFMKTDAYQQYTVAYDKFIKKNPGYEEKIASKLI